MFAAPETQQLAVRIDLVPLLGRIGLGRPQPFRERDDHDAERRAEQAEEVRGRDVGDPETGKPALDRSDGRDAVETEQMHRQDPEQHRHERGRDGAVPYLQPKNQREGQHADEHRQTARLIDVLDELPKLLEEVAGAFLDAEQLRQLADDDRQGQSDDEPLQDRLGDEGRDEPQPQDRCGDREQPDGDRERRRQLDVVAGSLCYEVAHDRR